MSRLKKVAELEQKRKEIVAGEKKETAAVAVCCGTGCSASGAVEVAEAFKKVLAGKAAEVPVKTRVTGCHGFCEQGPLVVIEKSNHEKEKARGETESTEKDAGRDEGSSLQLPGNLFYCRVKPGDVEEIVEKSVLESEVVERLLYSDPVTEERYYSEHEVPFYAHQERLIMGYNGMIEPDRIEDYLAVGGYKALRKILEENASPVEIIEEIKKSGLRGRGGGGFPTGQKWELCRKADGEQKYVICNADEGDPGCFQDRSILEGNPHLVLEGMIIAAYATGANKGYIYVRNEYPLALKNIMQATRQALEWGLLGEDILGSGFSFEVRISRGGGAFVCGEETALLSSIEGLTGEPNPRPRPPYPTAKGLFGMPTLINNVKTFAAVPLIISKGAEWHRAYGTGDSRGTMVFSLTGKVNNTGLVEVPMGMSLRELIYDIGGGIPGGRQFKAVQTGGPAGGCLPESMLDLPLDYEKLSEAGSIMGSGGMIVMDDATCMVDLAHYFLSFTVDESCGKCVPCREGGRQMLALLEKFICGQALEGDLHMIWELATAMQKSSLCALGKLAPNPVLTTLKYFEDEYRAHFEQWRCPAGVCRALISYSIDEEACNACGLCLKACSAGAISGVPDSTPLLEDELCTRCGACLDVCRHSAILVK